MPKFTDPTGLQEKMSLVRKLEPVADALRDQLTKVGLRQYKVAVVRVRWTGGARGDGVPEAVSYTHLLPTPKVLDLASLEEVLHPTGMQETGGIRVEQISGSYTEEQLRGLDQDGNQLDPSEEVFYEIEFLRGDNLPSLKRRFILQDAPQYFAGKLQWQMNLSRQAGDRDRQGDAE